MKNVSDKKEKNTKGKKSIKISKNKENNNIKTYEKYTCFVVGILIVLLLFAAIKNMIFIPALLITIGLECFCISYYYLENKEKVNLVYGSFIFGVGLIFAAIIYTIINTI